MEREQQLKNVAFGGDWSDQILVRERVQGALALLGGAVDDCAEVDAARAEVLVALQFLCGRIARGELMEASWRKAAAVFHQEERHRQLAIVLGRIKSGAGVTSMSPSRDMARVPRG